jgi:hypothetical protein
MKEKRMYVPITQGTVTTIGQDALDSMKFVSYGIYNVSIECDNPKAFTIVKSNMYTHTEVNYAIKLGLKITVLGNALLWTKDERVTFNKMFGEFVDKLYPYKKKHPYAKIILNSLWGGLIQFKGSRKRIISTHDDLELEPDDKIQSMNVIDFDKDLFEFTITNDKSIPKTRHARMKPFLLGSARVWMHKYIKRIGYEFVKYSHTDSMITTRRIAGNELNFQERLGCWKFEGVSYDCIVNNMNRYSF